MNDPVLVITDIVMVQRSKQSHDITQTENRKGRFQDKTTTFSIKRPLLPSNDNFSPSKQPLLPPKRPLLPSTRFQDKMTTFCRQNRFNPSSSFLQSSLKLDHCLSIDLVSKIIQLALT